MSAYQSTRLGLLGKQILISTLITALGLISALPVNGQTFKSLHSFGADTDGANPYSGVVVSGNTLYGSTVNGGTAGEGTVFRLNTNGTAFTNIYNFTLGAYDTNLNRYTSTDGASPFSVILVDDILYGAAFYGGIGGEGSVFKINTDGTGFTNLHSFAAPGGFGNSDGSDPRTVLTLSGNILYGAAQFGGLADAGSVFAVRTDGAGFTNLYAFSNGTDGAYPQSLVLSGNILYGTADYGGTAGDGSIFALNVDGTGFTNLYAFSTNTGYPGYINSDGADPVNKLVLSGHTLYGTTTSGGTGGEGTVFAVNTDGTGFTNLHNFTTLSGPLYTNQDGADPVGGLLLSGNILYGVASAGGTGGVGAIFALNINGSGFINLHNFTATSTDYPAINSDGAEPTGTLSLSGDTLFGSTRDGGSSGLGTVFSLTLPSPPRLAIARVGTNVILSWPTNAAGFPFSLQATTSLVSPAVWTNVNGNYTVTNPLSGSEGFYRLTR